LLFLLQLPSFLLFFPLFSFFVLRKSEEISQHCRQLFLRCIELERERERGREGERERGREREGER